MPATHNAVGEVLARPAALQAVIGAIAAHPARAAGLDVAAVLAPAEQGARQAIAHLTLTAMAGG